MSVQVHQGDCREVVPTANGITPDRALEVGKAAEHLVCADLILAGYRAYLTDQGLPYDIVVDYRGRLVRIQVKATMCPKPVPSLKHTRKYQWHVRRAGKGASRRIGNNEFDILALVALDIRVVAYLKIDDRVKQAVHLRPPGVSHFIVRRKAYTNNRVDEYPFSAALALVLS